MPGTLEMLLLGTLRRGAQRGHGIGYEIRALSAGTITVVSGSLYPALQRLERRGWLRSKAHLTRTNHRAKCYRLTAVGRLQLQREWRRWSRFVVTIESVMAPIKRQL